MPVNKRLNLSGPALAFITTTVKDWIPVFSLEKAALLVISQFEEASKFYGVAVIGYVLMPSHIHALVGFPEVAELSKYMQAFKSLTSRKLEEIDLGPYRSQLIKNGQFRLWKRRFDDSIIYSEKQLRIKLEYMHNNPVKDGFVDNPIQWEYSSAVDWLTDGEGLIEINKDYSWLNLG